MTGRKCIAKVPEVRGRSVSQEGAFRKKVGTKLQIVVEGRSKAAVAEDFEKLVDMLGEQLPMKLRLGRGKTTTINIEARS